MTGRKLGSTSVRAEIKHNFPGFMRKTVIAALIVLALVCGILLALWD